jgi:hypothetical protein
VDEPRCAVREVETLLPVLGRVADAGTIGTQSAQSRAIFAGTIAAGFVGGSPSRVGVSRDAALLRGDDPPLAAVLGAVERLVRPLEEGGRVVLGPELGHAA